MNDPNGLCWFGGYYHVFYQYAPFNAEGGIKFWGHYKSPDLLRWVQCPVMLYSDQPYDVHGVYSGSALCEEDGMYLYYTGNVKYMGGHDYIRTGRGHNTVLAYSPDGMTLGWKRLLMENKDYPAGVVSMDKSLRPGGHGTPTPPTAILTSSGRKSLPRCRTSWA